MHFEYIADAVSHGLMRVQLDNGVPLIFGYDPSLRPYTVKFYFSSLALWIFKLNGIIGTNDRK